MRLLTTADLCELADLPPRTLGYWRDTGIVVPEEAGNRGRGNGCGYAPMQVLGVMVAVAAQRTEHGCALAYARRVIAACSAWTEAELVAELEAGRDHLYGFAEQGPRVVPVMRPADHVPASVRVNARELYERLLARLNRASTTDLAAAATR